VGPVRVAGIDDIAALLRPALARQHLALEQALGQVKVRLRADPPRDPADAWRGGVVDGTPAHLKQDERPGGSPWPCNCAIRPSPCPSGNPGTSQWKASDRPRSRTCTATEQIPVS